MNVLLKLAALLSIFATGCQTTGVAPNKPAVLSSSSSENMNQLKAGLAAAMNKNTVFLGAGDPTQKPSVAVLPSRSTIGRDMAIPTMFDLMTDGKDCYAVKRGTDEMFKLEGVDCRAL